MLERLAVKIIILVAFVALVIGISSAYLAGIIMQEAMQGELENRALVICRSLNGLITQQVMEKDKVKTRFVLMNMVETTSEMQYAYVMDFDGVFFTHSFENGFPEALANEAYTVVSHDRPLVKRYLTSEGPVLDMDMPLIKGLDAQIHVGMSEKYVFAQVKTLRNRIILITFSIILFGVLIGIVTSFRITRPLARLVDAMNNFGKGKNEDEILIKSQTREIKELTKSFNLMIADRKKYEEEIRKSKEEWEKTFDAIGDIITIQDKNMRIVRANKAAHDFCNVQPGKLQGKYCHEVFQGFNKPCHDCPNISLADHISPVGILDHENHEKIFEITNASILDKNEELAFIVHIARDITEQKKLEDRLFQAQKMEAIGTLAGGIAHDFNNILFPILGHTEMLMEDIPKDSPFQENLDEIYNGALRARDLVQQILAFSRRDHHEIKFIKMQQIIKEALKLIRSTIPTTISVEQNLDPDCGPIKGDPIHVHQIVMNLSTNAYHAMEDRGGKLIVTLKQVELNQHELTTPDMPPGSYACLTISDTGMGMDKKLIDKIFEPFFTTKKDNKGTGMGLSVVHGIVRSMNGKIQIYSEPGMGSTFNIYIPIARTGYE